MPLLSAVETVNERQKHVLVDKIVNRFGEDLSGLVFALWGLAFKPGTDDVRQAPSEVVARELSRRGAHVQAYDPVAADEAQRLFGPIANLAYMPHAMDALRGADALVVVTEWKEFRGRDLADMRAAMKRAVVFDGRNIFEPTAAREAGFEYFGIGRP